MSSSPPAGVASRRDALKLITSGRVTVDGVVLGSDASYFVSPSSRVAIDGRPFLDPTASQTTNTTPATGNAHATHSSSAPSSSSTSSSTTTTHPPLYVPSHLPQPKLWLYYKPPGLLVSHKDERFQRPTIFQQIEEKYFPRSSSGTGAGSMPRLMSVGRLDYLSEGLMLLTQSGAIQQFLEHPSSSFTRTYRIRIAGTLTAAQQSQLEAGLNIDGFQFQPVRIAQVGPARADGRSCWYELTVTEGKNRELRTLLNYFDFAIGKLVRCGFHQWQLEVPHAGKRRPNDATTTPADLETTTYNLQPGEMIEVEWPTEMERRRIEWTRNFNAKRPALGHAAAGAALTTSWPNPSRTTLAGAQRSYHTTARRFTLPSSSSLSRRHLSSTSDSSPPSGSSPPAAARSRVYPEESGFFVVPERNKKPDLKAARGPKASLQRGAPPPRPLLPTPACLQHIDRPWMNPHLTLDFNSAGSAPDFRLEIDQWTGIEFASDDAADGGPVEEAGSGTIVWDAALHLVHHLQDTGLPTGTGTILELGSGTGALGLGVDKLTGGARRVVLTDEGPVLRLLRANVAQNESGALVRPFQWNDADAFLASLRGDDATATGASGAANPSFISLVLCSELLDTIPGPGNAQRAFDDDAFRTLVSTLTSIARDSTDTQRASGQPSPRVDVLFTFEQRGVLNLRDDGLLQSRLIEPMRAQGFTIKQVQSDIYQPGSDLCLLHCTYEHALSK